MIAILMSAVIAGGISLIGTPWVIRFFRRRGFGQAIREEGPEHHHSKAGTPTMGGTAFVLASVVAYFGVRFLNVRVTPMGLLVLITFVGMGMVGFADDFIKVRMRRNLGLNKTTKFLGQAAVAGIFGYLGPEFAGISREISVIGDIGFELPAAAYLVWIFLLLAGASNAVNLTDGLDGLAAGSATLVFGAYTIIAFWMARHPFDYGLSVNAGQLTDASMIDVAVIAAAATAGCAGFLWWNAPPAKIFMGDTGSLALGGLLAALATVTGTQLLLVVLGGLYVLETVSVIIQVFAFRVFGRRVFRMAPVHHHFELGGWAETTIIVRFWIVGGIGTALGVGVFYAEYLTRVGTGG
ncbi:MAG TPA: phospho-N-acetylmuramoyl-pentapeptide-transferase [Nitriliruptorales bacterium]